MFQTLSGRIEMKALEGKTKLFSISTQYRVQETLHVKHFFSYDNVSKTPTCYSVVSGKLAYKIAPQDWNLEIKYLIVVIRPHYKNNH